MNKSFAVVSSEIRMKICYRCQNIEMHINHIEWDIIQQHNISGHSIHNMYGIVFNYQQAACALPQIVVQP